MKIVINTRLWIPNKMDGIGRFTKETANLLASMMPDDEFVFLFDRPIDNSLKFEKNVKTRVLLPPTRLPFLLHFWFQYRVRFFLKRINTDIFISPDGFIPYKTKAKTISIIHDINFVHYPEFLPKKWLHYYNKNFPKILKYSSRIGTVSNFSKQDIINQFNYPVDKIDLYCNSASNVFKPLNNNNKQIIKDKYTKGKDYFLFVGTMHPRKNLSRIILAFEQFKEQTDNDIQFLIVGRVMFLNDEFKNVYKQLKHKEDIIFLPSMKDNILPSIYASAHALCYVSLFEGFGIPIIECFKTETLVITSNTSSMPEIAGDAALIVNPYHIEEIVNAMMLSCDDSIVEKLKAKGIKQHQEYTWKRCVNAIIKSIEIASK